MTQVSALAISAVPLEGAYGWQQIRMSWRALARYLESRSERGVRAASRVVKRGNVDLSRRLPHVVFLSVELGSLDELSARVAERRLVTVTLADLLGLMGRRRPTRFALEAVSDELAERSLDTFPPMSSKPVEVRIFRRDSAVAALVDAVMSPSPVGDQRLARPTSPPEDSIARDLADLLTLTDRETLEELSEAIHDDSDTDMWVHFLGEDEWSWSLNPGRNHGIIIHTVDNDSIALFYPFDVQELWRAAEELEAHAAFRSRLVALYDESDVDGDELVAYLFLGDVTRPCGSCTALWGDGPLELADRDDPEELAIVRFLNSGEIQFRLNESDVPELAEWVRISNRSRGRAERVVCSAESSGLVQDLLLKAAGKRMSQLRLGPGGA